MTPPHTPTALVQHSVTALNDRDRDAFADLHAPDAALHDHDETINGIDAIVAHEWARYDAFPDMEYTIDDIVADDDTAAGRWTVTGTHDGPFDGIEPTGVEIELPAQGMFRVDDGAIAEIWLAYDALGMLQQLGVLDPPPA